MGTVDTAVDDMVLVSEDAVAVDGTETVLEGVVIAVVVVSSERKRNS